MPDVRCSEAELQEHQEVVRVGHRSEHEARCRGLFFGRGLDDVERRLDRRARNDGRSAAIVRGGAAATAEICTPLQDGRDGRVRVAGAARVEPVGSTAETRRVPEELERTAIEPGGRGGLRRAAAGVDRAGVGAFLGRRIPLEPAEVQPLPPTGSG